MNGKGDKRRPGEGYASGWDRIYNKEKEVTGLKNDDYNEFVQSRWIGMEDLPNLAIATLGLAGESGEVAEKIKKQLRGDDAHNPLEHDDIKARNREVAKELGDVLFYLTWIANYHGYTIEQIMALNILKLMDRQDRTGTLRGDGDNR